MIYSECDNASSAPTFVSLGVEFDPEGQVLHSGRADRHLSPAEARVLCCLVQAASDRVVPRAELIDQVWGDREVGDEALTVLVSRLRGHFRKLGLHEPVIETVPKAGYRLARKVDTQPRAMAAVGRERVERISMAALVLAIISLGLAALALLPHLAIVGD